MPLPPEFALIAKYFAPLADTPAALGLSDDAALLAPPAGRQLVVAADAMVAGVHFLDSDPADTVARKLLRVNLSDLAAMAAEPLGFLLTIALPKGFDSVWLRGFAAGLLEDRRQFDVPLLGGDTVSTPGPATLSLTILGHVEPGRALLRRGAAAGEVVWVSGTLGDAALGLRVLQGRLRGLSGRHAAYLSERYRVPEPRLELGRALAGIATAALDVSDGLAQDIGHIARLAGCAAELEAPSLPRSEAAAAAIGLDASLGLLAVAGGDDYELAFTAPPGHEAMVRGAAEAAGIGVAPVGRLLAGEAGEVRVLDDAGRPVRLERTGWSHF
ncbi:MAG: thiamine-phosphate kinase [Acetobacteraceae bacterium]|nr:thiamine-phosphate kinase [Acetobacteraceae bacterium]